MGCRSNFLSIVERAIIGPRSLQPPAQPAADCGETYGLNLPFF
jgi:hypothetical protein